MRLAYTQEAVADLVRLRSFIAEHDPAAAARIARDLVARIERLRSFPDMGRNVAEAPQPDLVRDFVFGPYVIRYTVHADALIVLRVWHHLENRAPSA